MQTNKKYVKHVKHMKKTKKKCVSKKNKQFLCYKIRFYNSFKGNDGARSGGAGPLTNENKTKLVNFLNEYLEDHLKDKKTDETNKDIYKYLNNILNYDEEFDIVNKLITAIKKDISDVSNDEVVVEKSDNAVIQNNNSIPMTSMTSIKKPHDKTQLLEEIYANLNMKEYFDKEKTKKDEEIKNLKQEKYKELTDFLKKMETSQKIIDNIKNELEKLVLDKKITQSKADSVMRQLDGISIISSSLATINKSANSFGKWLSPEQFEQSEEDNSEKNNEQTIKFLWYPRKHINYKKGTSVWPKSYSKDDKYGDFMIYIDSPKYYDIGEYFKTSYNSVEDLFANILAGCDDMFCTKGNVKPTFYNSRLFIVKDKIIKDTK